MISQILKNSQKLEKITQAAFKSIDLNSNGYLEKDELQQIMTNVAEDIGVEKPSKQQIQEIVKNFDKNGQGRLDMKQFKDLVHEVLTIIAKTQQTSNI